ncbi:MAG TPA: DUF4157 domain-containing protein [Kofleriaceae bacterium]|nr:DUF4157 domain-containing protein [Kofleriaceae bacterium]
MGKSTRTAMLPPVQRKATGAEPASAAVHASAQQGIATAPSPLPFAEAIQRAFGRHDISSIQAHTGSDAAAAVEGMGAKAYATGNHVVLGAANDLHTAAHEAAHVVQQRGGVQLKGGVGEVGDSYEQHADAVADLVVRGESAEPLLDRYASPGAAATSTGAGIQRIVDDPQVTTAYGIAKTAGIDIQGEVKTALLEGGNLAVLNPIVNGNPGNFRKVYQYIALDPATAAQRVANLVEYRDLVDKAAVVIPEPYVATVADDTFLARIRAAVVTHDEPIKNYLDDMKRKPDRLRAVVALDPSALDIIAALVRNGARLEMKSETTLNVLLEPHRVCPPASAPTRWDWGPGNKGSVDANKEVHIDKHVLFIDGDPSARREAWQWKEVLGYSLGTADLAGLEIDPVVFQRIETCLGGPAGQLDSEPKYEEFFVTEQFQRLDPIKHKLRATWGQQYLTLASDLTMSMARYVTSRDFTSHRVHGQVNHGGKNIFIIGKVTAGAVAISSAYIPYQDEHGMLMPFVAWRV